MEIVSKSVKFIQLVQKFPVMEPNCHHYYQESTPMDGINMYKAQATLADFKVHAFCKCFPEWHKCHSLHQAVREPLVRGQQGIHSEYSYRREKNYILDINWSHHI
jgi:hypothetical protein